MLPDRVSNTGPLTYESGALPIALRGPAITSSTNITRWFYFVLANHEDNFVCFCFFVFFDWPRVGRKTLRN